MFLGKAKIIGLLLVPLLVGVVFSAIASFEINAITLLFFIVLVADFFILVHLLLLKYNSLVRTKVGVIISSFVIFVSFIISLPIIIEYIFPNTLGNEISIAYIWIILLLILLIVFGIYTTFLLINISNKTETTGMNKIKRERTTGIKIFIVLMAVFYVLIPMTFPYLIPSSRYIIADLPYLLSALVFSILISIFLSKNTINGNQTDSSNKRIIIYIIIAMIPIYIILLFLFLFILVNIFNINSSLVTALFTLVICVLFGKYIYNKLKHSNIINDKYFKK